MYSGGAPLDWSVILEAKKRLVNSIDLWAFPIKSFDAFYCVYEGARDASRVFSTD